jgi:NAD(P)-dependent dehydrogenase (short-subunit alcohol dehydrogenase family)
MQLNYFGAVKLTLAVLPGMRARKWGHIINISSIGVEMNMPRFSAYVASKAALDAFSACLAGEVHDDGVRITTIYMPLVRTPMIAPTTMYKSFPTLTTDEAADIIEEAIVSRPKHIGTRIGSVFGIAYALNAGAVDGLVNIVYHLFPESKAASADSGGQGVGQERPPDAPMLARWLRDPIGRRGAPTERNHSRPHTQVRPGHAKRSAAARGSST